MDLFTRLEQSSAPPKTSARVGNISLTLLHSQECKACPLNRADVVSPKMKPTGDSDPLIYVLGEAPGKDEDQRARQFVGNSGRLLREYLGDELSIRFNNVIRTRPPGNRTPQPVEIECCRPSIIRDIEASKPKAIFGFGNIPLQWVTGLSGISHWRGRKMPVQIGKHKCWFFPMLHPAFVLRAENERGEDKLGREWRGAFVRDLRRAKALVSKGLPDPIVHSPEMAMEGVESITGGDGAVKRILDFIGQCKAHGRFGVDLETSTLRPFSKGARILSIALSIGQSTIAFPLHHPSATWSSEELKTIESAIRGLFHAELEKDAHNAKFEMEWMGKFYGDTILRSGQWVCTQSGAYVLDERAGSGVQSLNGQCIIEFGLPIKNLSEVQLDRLEEEPLYKLLPYNGLDAKYAYLLASVQKRKIKAEKLEEPFTLQQDRLPTVTSAQIDGMPVDQERVEDIDKRLAADERRITEEINRLPDVQSFNKTRGRFIPSSPKSVAVMLREHLKRREGEQEDGGYSTDAAALQAMTGCKVAEKVLALRKVSKLRSTYAQPLLIGSEDCVVYPDGLLHTNFNTTFTDTGRLSSDGPNMQNFPKRTNAEMREMIRCSEDELIVAADYGQIEARVIAMASKDERLVKALWENYDIHMDWAERVAKIDNSVLKRYEAPDLKGRMKKLRADIKNQLVFPAFYGAHFSSIARGIRVDERKIERLFDDFWDEFRGVKKWQDVLIEFYEEHGYVECLTKRRRHGPMTRNMAINSPIQGTASDMVVGAMDRLSVIAHANPAQRYLQARLNIHDDLTFVIPKKRVDDGVCSIVEQMVAVKYNWVNVPIMVEVSVGSDWFRLKEIGKFESNKL